MGPLRPDRRASLQLFSLPSTFIFLNFFLAAFPTPLSSFVFHLCSNRNASAYFRGTRSATVYSPESTVARPGELRSRRQRNDSAVLPPVTAPILCCRRARGGVQEYHALVAIWLSALLPRGRVLRSRAQAGAISGGGKSCRRRHQPHRAWAHRALGQAVCGPLERLLLLLPPAPPAPRAVGSDYREYLHLGPLLQKQAASI